jgi:hypothetical protein
MGCCENSRNFLGYQNKNSTSNSSKGIKETNLSNNNNNKANSAIYLDNVLKSLLRNKTPKINLNRFRKCKVLDRINEEESESKESTIQNQKILSKEKIRDSHKKEILKNKNKKLENIKILRKNRTHPKFKTILSQETFIKKINEYAENNSKIKGMNNYANYVSQLSHLKESKSEQLFGSLYDRSGGDSSLKDSINKIINQKKSKKYKKTKITNIYKKIDKGNLSQTQYYEEEINKNSIQYIPRNISNIISKKSIEQECSNS